MKPQAQLQLSTIILMSVIILLGYILFVVSVDEMALVSQGKLVGQIVREITEQHFLAAEYVAFQDERTKSQLDDRHATLTQVLQGSAPQFTYVQEQTTVSFMQKANSDFEETLNLVEKQLRTSSPKEATNQRLIAQLFEKSELLISYTFEMTGVIVSESERVVKKGNLLTGIAVVALIIIIGLQSRLILREEISVTETISEMLQKQRMKL